MDLIIIPGLAFTPKGHRLGRGKGYYDKFLHSMAMYKIEKEHDWATVALAFKEQVIDDLPVEPTDYLIDQVLYTEAS